MKESQKETEKKNPDLFGTLLRTKYSGKDGF